MGVCFWIWIFKFPAINLGQEFGQVLDTARDIRKACDEADDETELIMEGIGTAKKGKFMAMVEAVTVREGGHRITVGDLQSKVFKIP